MMPSSSSHNKRTANHNNLITISRSPLVPTFKPCKAIDFCLFNARSIKNKAAEISEFVVDNNVDILALTETWLSPGDVDNIIINEITPIGYAFRHVPRRNRGGGVALLFKKSLSLKMKPTKRYSSFELIDTTMKFSATLLRIIVVYRPPPSKANGLTDELFFSEFTTYLEQLSTDYGKVLITGDFNFHVEDRNKLNAQRFLQTLHSFDYKQHVNVATHKKNHTLDLIIARSNDALIHKVSVMEPALSDHQAVQCKIMLAKPHFIRKEISYRKLKAIDYSRLNNDIDTNEQLNVSTSHLSLDDLVELYEKVLKSLLDDHAPIRKKVITLRPKTPWYSKAIQQQKVERRRLERRWRKTRLTVHRQIYTEKCEEVNRQIASAKSSYYSELISGCGSDQRELFRSVEKLFHGHTDCKYPVCDSADLLANRFADYFEKKITVIQDGLLLKCSDRVNPPSDSCLLQDNTRLRTFTSITCDQLATLSKKIVAKSCLLDPIPAQVLKECFNSLLPTITKMVNISLQSAVIPQSLKVASLQPRLKKASLDPDEFNSFRPISNLKFISKSIEKVVADQTVNT